MAIFGNELENARRIVRNRRWMHVSQLEVGMYVSELDRPWSDTPFLFQGFWIDSMETLREVQRICSNVLAETEKLTSVPMNGASRLRAVR